jgi:hypothetical protein
MKFIYKFINIVLIIILFFPRLFLFLFGIGLTFLYKRINKKGVQTELEERRRLIEIKKRLHEENNELKEKVFEYDTMIKDISRQEKDGKSLLGIHHIESNQLQYDSSSKQYIKKFYSVYFMFYQTLNTKTFFLTAHYAGQMHKYLKDEKYDTYQEPENKTWIFRIEVDIFKKLGEIQIHQLNTRNDFRNLGIATLGLEYLKKIAMNQNIKRIYGIMDNNEDLPKFYSNRGFNVIYPGNPLSNTEFEVEFNYANN